MLLLLEHRSGNGEENGDHNNIIEKTNAVSLSRVEYCKSTEMIMNGNRLLGTSNRIILSKSMDRSTQNTVLY
jgi:hypothetical protein